MLRGKLGLDLDLLYYLLYTVKALFNLYTKQDLLTCLLNT